MPTPLSSAPSGSCPLLGRSTLQGVTKAAMDKTLASGPMVAATKGIAVDANHHFLDLQLEGNRYLQLKDSKECSLW